MMAAAEAGGDLQADENARPESLGDRPDGDSNAKFADPRSNFGSAMPIKFEDPVFFLTLSLVFY
jgi:hypothetical protein